ncbi:MAG: VOC family protein [Candidatus Andersenbacteria bacterium]
MSSLKEIIGDYDSFLDEILALIAEEGFKTEDLAQLDHVCYRTVSYSNYEQKKKELKTVALLLGETVVNNRPIATFRLIEPIIHNRWRIDAIELPAPKPGSKYLEGLEHVEFVIFDDMQKFVAKYSHKQFDLRSVKRGINPELGFDLGKYSVKFHLLNLPTVIYLEEKIGIKEVSDTDKALT